LAEHSSFGGDGARREVCNLDRGSAIIPLFNRRGDARRHRAHADWRVSYILAQVSLGAGLISQQIYNATLAASLVTILANATLFRFVKPAATKLKISAPAQTTVS
jgi:hypothetical protein